MKKIKAGIILLLFVTLFTFCTKETSRIIESKIELGEELFFEKGKEVNSVIQLKDIAE